LKFKNFVYLRIDADMDHLRGNCEELCVESTNEIDEIIEETLDISDGDKLVDPELAASSEESSEDNLMGNESIGRLLVRFSIPAIISMLVNALYNVVDSLFVGNINPNDSSLLTGVGLTLPITTVILAFSLMVGIGASARISIKLGEGRKNEAELILGNALTLSAIISFFLAAAGLIFVDDILRAFGASDVSIVHARDYIEVILIGTFFNFVSVSLNHPIRGAGHPVVASVSVLTGALMNVILDPIFIFVFNMGVRGAAVATVISQVIAAMWIFFFYFSRSSTLKFRLKNLPIHRKAVLEIISIGMSPFAMQLAASSVMIVANKVLSSYGGDEAVAAMTVIQRASVLVLMPIIGMNQGAQPIIGYNYGARKYDRVIRTLKYAVIAATVISVVGFLGIQIFPEFVIKAFNSDPKMLNIGINGIRVFFLMLPFVGAQILCTNYFQSVGMARISMFLSLLRQVILLIPLYFVLPQFFGLDGIWYAAPVADLTSFIITLVFISRELRKLKYMHLAEKSSFGKE